MFLYHQQYGDMQARSRSTKQRNDTLSILFIRPVRNVEEEYIDQTTLWTSFRKLIKSKIQTKISLEKDDQQA